MPRRIPPFLFRSVRGRLALLVAALVLPVVALATVMVFQAYRNERATIVTALLSTSRAVSRVVDGELEKSDVLLSIFANSDAASRNDLAVLDGTARRVLKGDSRWLVVLRPDGQQVLNTRVPPGEPLRKVTFEPDFIAAMRRGEVYVSSLRRSLTTGEPVSHVSRPYFRDGQLTYIFSMTIPPVAWGTSFDLERYAPGRIVSIVDQRGIIVARSLSPEKYVGSSATPDIVAAIARRSEGVVDSVTLEGVTVLTAFSHGTHGWSTIIGARRTELNVSARRLLAWGIAGSAALILVAIAMAAWIGRAVVHGVDVLHADAAALGRGQTPPATSTGLDETDFVAEAMRGTAVTLLQRTHTLEVLNRIAVTLVAERDIERIVESVTDAGRELSGAEFGAFYYNAEQSGSESHVLHTLAGDARPIFERRFERVRRSPLFESAFVATEAIRLADFSASAPSKSAGAVPAREADGSFEIRSLLAVPLKSRTGRVIGALFYGHSAVSRFGREIEEIVTSLAAEAAIAIDNAKLYHALSLELDAKSKAEGELRLAQSRLSDHARELERKVEERTASLQDAVTQMEEFSYTVSHDLRSPLRAMHAFADALLEDYGPKLDDTARDYLRRIQRASRRMDQLTTDLLSYSRVARAEVHLQPTNVEALLRSTIDHYVELQPAVADVTIASPLDPVLAHEPSLTQCLANLLTNAAKFVRSGERPRITIRTERNGDRVKIWVEDQGIGIAPESQGRLFRIFERGSNSQRFEGTGIGLAIVRKATEKMGGSCGMISDGKTGSRFWIELAAAPSE